MNDKSFDVVGDKDLTLVFENILYHGRARDFRFKEINPSTNTMMYQSADKDEYILPKDALEKMLEDQESNDIQHRGKQLQDISYVAELGGKND